MRTCQYCWNKIREPKKHFCNAKLNHQKCSFCGEKGKYIVLYKHDEKDVCWQDLESEEYWDYWWKHKNAKTARFKGVGNQNKEMPTPYPKTPIKRY